MATETYQWVSLILLVIVILLLLLPYGRRP